jgi:hypothetical protein
MADQKRLFVVTAPAITDTGRVSFKFLFDSKAQNIPFDTTGRYGQVMLEDKHKDEVDPFKLARGEPGAVGPNGTKKWRICIGNSKCRDLAGSVNECPNENERGLQELLKDAGEAALLMERGIFDRFELAAKAVGYEVLAHHFDGTLSTS